MSLRRKDLNSAEDEGKDLEEDPKAQKAQGHGCENLCLENHVLTTCIDKQSIQGYSSASLQTDPLGSADGESATQLLMLQRPGWVSNDSLRPGDLS